MAKQLNVSLAFTADSSKAKKEIQDLQNQLTNLIQIGNKQDNTLGLSKSIQNAIQKAAELKSILSSAVNVNTGNLDLSKFSESLQRSNRSLSDYQKALSGLGPEGNKAFLSLAQSVNKAEVPLKRTNGLVSELWTTLKNTARWQLSSSILHGFMGSLQSAYRYAQDLDQSLNNIRIVTGYSSNEMAKFADQANKAAQSLSTTTTKYTDAALIYYQQGIRDQKEIAGRTETTIKLANVSRQSAEEVSSQMTAIWNNFDDGSHSLEYYADVITALGATTASSSQEIAKGMQQFAAVAETVGLSYDYAAASLATIVATTRQSESTVGNGLRTIFSRLEGLKLGDTLEDGTDLNKYSTALATIGVDIKDVSGNLKDMDTILEETASKWDTLDKAQKVAFATTVGGVRQYTNLIALLDNWDMVQANLNTARNSEGTLDQQAEIYAESWEAARKRVKSAAEDIYDSLIDKDFFITIDNGLAKFLNQINNLIKGLGGLKGVLATVLTLGSQLFNNQISQSLDNMVYSLKMSSEKGRQSIIDDKKRVNDLMINSSIDADTTSGTATAFAFQQQGIASNLVLENVSKMSALEKEVAQQLLDQNSTLAEEAISLGEQLEQQQAISKTIERRTNLSAKNAIQNSGVENPSKFISGYEILVKKLKDANQQYYNFESAVKRISAIKPKTENIDKFKIVISSLQEYATNAGLSLEEAFGEKGAEAINRLNNVITTTPNDINAITSAQENLNSVLDGNLTHIDFLEQRLRTLLTNAGVAPQQIESIVNNLKTSYEDLGVKTSELTEGQERLKNSTNGLKNYLNQVNGESMTLSSSMVSLFGTITSISMAINTLKGLGSIWSDEDTSILDKVLSTTMSLGMAIPILTKALSAENRQKTASALASIAMAISDQTATSMNIGATVARKAETLGLSQNTAAKLANVAATIALYAPLIAVIAALGALVGAIYLVNKAHNASAEEAKKASKAAQELKEEYNNTKTAYEDLKKSIEQSDKAIEAISKLKEGTQEWRDAIRESNEEVLALIGNYPALAQAVSRDKNGILSIDKDSQYYKEFMQGEKDKVDIAYENSLAGMMLSNNAAYNNDLFQSGTSLTYKGKTYDDNGNLTDETLSMVLGGGRLQKAVNLYNQDETLFKDKDSLKTALGYTSDTLNGDEIVNSLITNLPTIQKLAETQRKNTEANKTAAEQIGMIEFAKANPQLEDKYVQALGSILGDSFDQALSEQTSEYKKKSEKDIQNEYAKANNFTYDKKEKAYIDNETGELHHISTTAARNSLVTSAAMSSMQDNFDLANIAANGLKKANNRLSGYLGKDVDSLSLLLPKENGKLNFSSLTEEQFENFKKAWNDVADKNGSITSENFAKIFGIDNETAEALGKGNAENYMLAVQDGIRSYADDVKQAKYDAMSLDIIDENALSKFQTTNKVIDSVSSGKDIDPEVYNGISENLQAFFEETVEGTYRLKIGAEEAFKAMAQDDKFESFNHNLEVMDEQMERLKAARDTDTNLIALKDIKGSDTTQDKLDYLMNSGNIKIGDYAKYSDQYKEGLLSADAIEEINSAYNKAVNTARDYDAEIKQIEEDQKKLSEQVDAEKLNDELKKIGIDRSVLNEEIKIIQKLNDELAKDEKAAQKLALANLKVQQGIKALGQNIDSYTKNLVKGNEDTLAYAESMDSAKEVMSQILNTSKSNISDNFILDNLKDIEKAAYDDEEALERIREAANKEIALNIKVKDQDFKSELDQILQDIEAEDLRDIEIGTSINENETLSNYTDLLNEMSALAMLAGDDISNDLQAAMDSINFDPKIDYDELNLADADTATAESTGYVEVPTIHTNGDGSIEASTTRIPLKSYEEAIAAGQTTIKVPRINGKGTRSKGGVSSGGSTGKKSSGGGGGGGGGGSKPKAAKTKDYADSSKNKKKDIEEKEKERYYEINNQLKTTEQLLNKINTAKDRAFGRNKIAQIDKEIKALAKEITQYDQLIKEDKEWLEVDKKRLAEYNVTFDAEGNMNNYDEIFEAEKQTLLNAVDTYDQALIKAVDDYNAAMADAATKSEEIRTKLEEEIEKTYKAAEKAANEQLDDAQKRFDHFQEYSDQYHTTLQKIEDDMQKQQELHNQRYDNELEKITYIVELKIDVKDRDIALLEDLLEDIGDKADSACDAIANFGNQLEDTLDKVDTYTQEVSDILEHAGADEDLIDKIMNHDFDESDWEDVLAIGQDGKGLNENEIEHLKNVADALLASNKEMRRLREEALKKTGEAFDEFNEQLDRSIGQIEHLTTVTQTYRDVLDIVGKDVLDRNGKLTDALNKQTYNIQRNHTHALQAQLDFIDTALDKAQALYDEAVENGYNQKTLESLKADVEKYEDERQATYEEWLDSWKQECQIAKDYYEDTLNQILSDFEDAVAGQFKNLSGLSKEFARKNEIADIYVEDYEKIYQLNKLNRDINNSLDDSTTLASKGKLRDIQKEINELQESGVEVSQYDLDVLRKKYEMALAYEQWQDAQNAKTIVRMQRDNEGNYGYVYTADQSDVEAAEQNYEDKLHEMQVLNAEYIQSLQEQIIQAQQDCADALANLRAEDFASYEEYQDAVEQIRKDYTKRIETLSQQMENAMDNNRTLYEEDWTAYSQATGYKISADEDYIDRFDETVYAQLTGFETMQEAQDAFVDAVNDASDQAAENWEDWYTRTNTALDDAGLSMQNYADEVGDRVEQLGEEAERAEEDVWNMSDEFSDAYSDISDTVANFLDEYSNYIDAMIEANQELVDSINQVIAAYAELNGEENDEDFEPDDYEWINLKEGTGDYDWRYRSKSTGKDKTGDFEADYTHDGVTYRASYKTDASGSVLASDTNFEHNGKFGMINERVVNSIDKLDKTMNQMIDDTPGYVVASETSIDKLDKTMNQMIDDTPGYVIASGASGMYTGDWGDNSGKIGVLHKKELVLNADDTSNILSAVDMIRSISSAIDLNALAASSAFASPNAAYRSSFGMNETLEQNVHISAEFPNVSDHNEIEEALNNLVERAAQFAGRKKF